MQVCDSGRVDSNRKRKEEEEEEDFLKNKIKHKLKLNA
jgi:hypothetical protein